MRKQLWGAESEPETEDVKGNTYLGDVTTPAPIVVASGGNNSSLGPLLAAALGMLAPLGGVAGYFVNQMITQKPTAEILGPPTQQTTVRQEDLTVRLLRAEDLKK